MSQSNDAPREFWLYDNGESPFLAFYSKVDMDEEIQGRQIDKYHVIEHAAYAKLKAERDELRAKLDVARAALEDIAAFERPSDGLDEHMNKIAREALEKLNEEL